MSAVMSTTFTAGPKDTPVESDDVKKLRLLFAECDKFKTGRVRLSTLLDYIRRNAQPGQMSPEEKASLEQLALRLDPRRDDNYVSLPMLLREGLPWVRRLSEQQPWPPSPERVQPPDESSLGLLDTQQLGCTFGSLEGIGRGGGDSASSEQRDPNAALAELEELRSANGKLSEENASLRRACAQAEDHGEQLQLERQADRQRLRELQRSLERATAARQTPPAHVCDAGELREALARAEERCSRLKARADQADAQLQELLAENCRLQQDLTSQQRAVETARQNERLSSSQAEACGLERDELLAERGQLRDELQHLRETAEVSEAELALVKEEARQYQRELDELKQRLERENDEEEQKFWAAVNDRRREDEITFEEDDDPFEVAEQVFGERSPADADEEGRERRKREIRWNNLNADKTHAAGRRRGLSGPTTSTPFIRNFRPGRSSIGDEIKDQLGVGDAGAGSPFCEKTANKSFSKSCLLLQQTREGQGQGVVQPQVEPEAKATDGDGTCYVSEEGPKPAVSTKEQATMTTTPALPAAFGLAVAALTLILFALVGAVQYGESTLYPILWHPSLGLPEPWVAIKLASTERRPMVW